MILPDHASISPPILHGVQAALNQAFNLMMMPNDDIMNYYGLVNFTITNTLLSCGHYEFITTLRHDLFA